MAIIKPYPKIREQGFNASLTGKKKTDNPYQYCSLKNHGPQKAAAWNAGYVDGQEYKKKVMLKPE